MAAEQYAQSQRQIQTQQQAFVATQTQLRQQQAVQVQTQAEDQRRTYITQIRLAKQAWDRGDTNEVLRLLQPYQADPNRQKLCTFAWYYLWRAAHNSGSIALRGHTDVVRQVVVTPDGSQILTFGDDGQLIAWDAASGRRLGGMALERNVPPKSSGLIVEDQLAHRAAGLSRPQRCMGRRLWQRPVRGHEHPPARRRAAGFRSPIADHFAGHQR